MLAAVAPGKTLIDQSEIETRGGYRYALTRWEGLTRFIDDGRIEIDFNTVELRPIKTIASIGAAI